MALVQVSATARLRCRDSSGRFSSEELSASITVEEQLDNDAYIPALYSQIAGEVPANCIGVSWTFDSIVPVEGGPPGTGEPVTIFFLVWCVDEDGNEYGPKTQSYDATTDEDIELIHANVDAIARAFCDGILIPGSPPVPMQFERWQITSPAMYQYFRG